MARARLAEKVVPHPRAVEGVVVLRALQRSIDTGSSGLVLADAAGDEENGPLVITDQNRPHNTLGDLVWQPVMKVRSTTRRPPPNPSCCWSGEAAAEGR